MDSMGFITKQILLPVVFSSLHAPNFLLPGMLQKLKLSVKEVRLYMEELVLGHMQSPQSNPSTRKRSPSLLSAIVSANEFEKRGTDRESSSYLTESELYGNRSVFNLGGYATIAETLIFTLP